MNRLTTLKARASARRMWARRSMVLAGTAMVVFGVGLAVGMRTPTMVQAAACQIAWAACSPSDTTRTAAVDVLHKDTGGMSVVDVQPNTGESLTITAYWDTATGSPCTEISETASVDVDWNTVAAAWGTTNANTTANIVGFNVCDLGHCVSTSASYGWTYRLIADVRSQVVIAGIFYNLNRVVFATTSVDNGNDIDVLPCTLGSAVSPTSQNFSATDINAFECAFTCANATATTLTITYQ